MPSSQSSTPCGRCKVLRDQLYTAGDERDRAIETRENANAVSGRLEADRDLWKRDAEAYRAQTQRYVAALCELHRAVDEHDGSDADVARLEDALVEAREMAPYVPQPPDPDGF